MWLPEPCSHQRGRALVGSGVNSSPWQPKGGQGQALPGGSHQAHVCVWLLPWPLAWGVGVCVCEHVCAHGHVGPPTGAHGCVCPSVCVCTRQCRGLCACAHIPVPMQVLTPLCAHLSVSEHTL